MNAAVPITGISIARSGLEVVWAQQQGADERMAPAAENGAEVPNAKPKYQTAHNSTRGLRLPGS